jgi:hypothetical protein
MPNQLSEPLHRRLDVYALAASAAGVSLLALVEPVEARIVYTRANKHIRPNTTLTLDLNHDGIADFNLVLRSFSATATFIRSDSLNVRGLARVNEIWGYKTSRNRGYDCAAALPKGTSIGPKSPFLPGALVMFWANETDGGGESYCPWGRIGISGSQPPQAYLGLKFWLKEKAHYGWARLGNINTSQGHASADLTDYAYETIPNKSIIAGKTHGKDEATLGRLAQGASAERRTPAAQ